MLNYNEIKRGKVIDYNGEPHKVMFNNIAKKNRNKPTNQTKLKSLVSGKNIDVTFHAKDKIEEAYIEKRDLKYLYQKGAEVWFCAADNPKDRFDLDLEMVENDIQYLKTNDVVRGEYYDDELIGLSLPPKVTLKVTEAPEAVAGNTSSGATKRVVVETGLEVFTPLFIKEGEFIVISTEDGSYSERAK